MRTRVQIKRRRDAHGRYVKGGRRRIKRARGFPRPRTRRKATSRRHGRYEQPRLGPWVCDCGTSGSSGGKSGLRRHENTKAHSLKMQEDRRNNVGLFSPEREERIIRELFARGNLISTYTKDDWRELERDD